MLRKLKLSRSDYQIGGSVQSEPIRRSSSNSGSILPQSNNAAPSMHPVVREVTEDTPPDLLEGTMDLLVVLPSKKTVRMTVSRRTPMMDLLVQVTTANKIAPGGHIVQVRNERGIELPYKPSTPIGALDTTTIEIVPKNQVNEYIIVKKQTAKIANQPFEQTFRLQVHLPRNQLYVMRVGPKTQLEEILKEVCREKNLDCSKYEIRHPVKLDERLPLDGRIGDFELQELNVVSRNSRINSSVSTADIMALQGDEALSKGCLIDSAFKHSRSSVGDSSVSSESAASARGISPSRSDDSRSISPLPPLRPKMKLNTTVSNASSSSGTSSTVPRIIQQQPLQLNKSPVEPPPRTKKRAAPQPPTLSSSSTNVRASQSEGLNRIIESKPPAPIKPTPRKKEPPKDPPGWSNNKTTALPIHHSRHSSDSSGYHEACEPHHHEIHRLDRQQSVPTINVSAALAVQQRVTSSVSVSNLTTVPSISTTSLASSNGGVRKRKAPKPPSAPVIPKEIIAEESPTVSEEHPAPPPPVANNNTKRISESAPSLTREETLVDEVETKVVPAAVLEEPVKAITVDLTADDKSVVLEESSLSESLAESSYTASEVSTGTSSATTTSSSSPVPTSPEEISTPRVPSSQEIRTETSSKRSSSLPDDNISVVMDSRSTLGPVVPGTEGDEAQDDVEVTQGGSSESEGSFSDSGVRVSEETATPSPDAAILGQLEKESESLQSSRRSSLEHEPEDEATLRELLQAKLENEHEIIDKAFEGIELGDEDQAKSPVDGGANPNFDLAPSPAMTKALESMTPSPMPVTDHTSDDDRALTPSSEEEPAEEPEGLFIPERKISKSESFSHNSEFDSARKRRIFSKDGSKATLKNTYMSSSEEDLSERMSNNRAESMQNLSRNSNNNNNNSNASQEKTDEDRPTVVRKRSANRPPRSESFRKTASVINMQDIDPAIAQNPELMATFQSELEAQFEQLKAKFLQKYGQLPNPDTVDSKQQEKQVTASNNESPLERSESPVTNVKQVLETEAQVHAEVPGKSALEVLNSSTSVQEQSVAIVQETTTVQEVNVTVQEIVPVAQEELQTQANEPVEVSEHAEPVKPELVSELSQTVKEAVTEPPKPPTPEPVVQAEVPEEIQVPVKVEEPAPIQDSETVQVPEPIQDCESVQAVEPIQEAVPLEIKPAIEEVQKVEAAVEILATAIVNNIPDQQEEPEKVEEMPITQKEEPVQEVEKEEEEPQRIYKYSGPPTIKMATWGERPQRSVSVKRDNDYIMGFGQHGSVAAKVNTYSDANSKPPLPRPAVTPAVTPSVPSKPVVELRTAATLPSVLSNWKQKMEQNRKSAPPTTVASVEIETAKDNVPAASTLERVKKSFTEHSSSPPPLSRVNGDVRRPKNVDDTDAASDYSSSSSSRPNSSLSRVPSNASISNATVSDSTSSSPVPPTASLSERRRLFQIKPMESSKEKPIPAQNLRGNIATIQRVFEQQQQQQQQQQHQQAQSQQSSLKSSRAGSISSTTSSIDSSPAPSISIRSNSPVSSVAVMQKVLRGNSVNLDEFRRTPSPSASSMSSTSLRSSEHSRQASPLPSTEVASTNRIVIESKPRDSVIRNAQNRSIIIVSNEDVVDSNPYKQKLRVTAAAPELKRAEPAKVEIVQGGGQLRRTPSTPIIISAAAPNIEIPVGTGKVSSIAAELKSSNNGFFSSLGRQAKDSSVNRQPTSKPIIIDGVEKPRKVSAVAAPEVVSGPAKNVVTKKDTGSVPPPPPPPSNMQFNGGLPNNNNNSRPKSLNMSQQAAKSSSNTPTSPSDPRSEILDAIKNSNGKFGLKKTGSAILLR